MDTPTPTVPTLQGDTPAAGESVLVPRELTPIMRLRLRKLIGKGGPADMDDAWAHVLAAAPVASPVRTDADGARAERLAYYDLMLDDVKRAVIAFWSPTNPAYEPDKHDMGHMADALHAAFAGRRLEAPSALSKPEGETGPAVAEDFEAWLSTVDGDGQLGDRLVTLPPMEIARQAWAAALTVSPSPFERTLPVARVINDNQPDQTAIVTVLCDPPTLDVGTMLYRLPFDQATEMVKAFQAGMRFAAEEAPSERDQHQGETHNTVEIVDRAYDKCIRIAEKAGATEIAAKLREEKEWEGLSCYCGGGWKVGHHSNCPEALAALSPEPHPVADKREGGDR